MVFGRKGTYAALAVLAAVLTVTAVLLAAPAWSQSEKNKKDSADARETAEGRSAQVEKKASGSSSAGEKATEERSAQAEKKESQNIEEAVDQGSSTQSGKKGSKKKASKSLDGKEVTVQKDTSPKDEVETGDELVISGDFKEPSSDASITVEDKDGVQGTFVNGDNAEMTLGSLKIAVTADPVDENGDSVVLNAKELKVKDSKGVKLKAKKKGRGGKGRRGRGGRGLCDQILRLRFGDNQGAGSIQYSNIDALVQECIVERGGNPFPFDDGVIEEIEIEEEVIEERISPDGLVLDTSALRLLPNTGGPSLSGGALIAGLALLSAGAGVTMWRFGGRRGRSDD